MVSINVLPVLNEYYEYLSKACGTIHRQELNRLCLLPLLKDIVNGPMSFYVTDKDSAYIDEYIKGCFSELLSKSNTYYGKVYLIYSGTSDFYPTDNVILNTSLKYASSESKVISPLVSGKYFWIAIPKGLGITSVDNKSFIGDFIPKDRFQSFDTAFDGLDYVVYYTESVIPLNSTYIISIERN